MNSQKVVLTNGGSIRLGNTPVMPLEDHPWEDRGFAILDPNGIVLYIYTSKEPAAEFKPYYK